MDFLLDFFTEERSYQGLKDATSFGLISDKSAKIRGLEYWKNCQFSIHTKSAILGLLVGICKLADDDVTSGQKNVARQPEQIPIFRIFPLEDLSAFSRLDNK